jgi:hypothetical protein
MIGSSLQRLAECASVLKVQQTAANTNAVGVSAQEGISQMVTQSPARVEHFEFHRTFVAGRRFNAEAEVAPGDTVFAVREPQNPHDANAIAVVNQEGQRIGYLPRELAAQYAGLVDVGIFQLAARLASSCEPDFNDAGWTINPRLYLWAHVDVDRLNEFHAQSHAPANSLPPNQGFLAEDQPATGSGPEATPCEFHGYP